MQRFRRPRHTNPTAHLWLANCVLSPHHLQEILTRYHVPRWIDAYQQKSVVFVSFGSADEAILAKQVIERLAGSGEFENRAVKVEFSEIVQDREIDAVENEKGSLGMIKNLDVLGGNVGVPGLFLMLDFISADEEIGILENIYRDKESWDRGIKRRVQHYGFEFDYETRNVNIEKFARLGDLPEFLNHVVQRMPVPRPDQLTINEYPLGQGISPHIDTHSAFESCISSLSLGSQAVMSFVNCVNNERIDIVLPRRSLLIMSGESRYAWTHHIPQRKYDRISGKLIQRSTRVSLTFRNVRGKPCTCLFPKFCDIRAQEGKDAEDQNFVLDTKTLPNVSLQNEFVTKFYDTVAEHFSRSRYKPWPKVETFLSNFQSDSFIADIGCGNGKYLGCSAAKSLEMYGIDISKNLVQICKDRGFNAQIGTIEAIPFSDEKFDGVICIAVFHHLHSLEIRIQALIELCRICKPKSRILIYAWAFEQEQNSKRKFEHQDVFVPWELQEEQSVSESPESSSRIYDTRDGVVFNYDSTNYRYCHLYKKGELEDLVKLGNVPVSVVDTYYDTSNWCIVLEKL